MREETLPSGEHVRQRKAGWPLLAVRLLESRTGMSIDELLADRQDARIADLEGALEGAERILMEHQRGESGLPFKPARQVIRPALEVIASALSSRKEKE